MEKNPDAYHLALRMLLAVGADLDAQIVPSCTKPLADQCVMAVRRWPESAAAGIGGPLALVRPGGGAH